MIISRDEFDVRWTDRSFEIVTEVHKLMRVDKLYKEIEADAKYRNHEYLFDGSNLADLPFKETTSGILERYPELQTEAERIDKIELEILQHEYRPVEVFQDIDHPTIIYIGDGFHRIYAAYKLGNRYIKCNIKKGHFKLSDDLKIRDIIRHMEILGQITGAPEITAYAKKTKEILDKEYDHGVKFGDVRI